jgi:hypothetical protein
MSLPFWPCTRHNLGNMFNLISFDAKLTKDTISPFAICLVALVVVSSQPIRFWCNFI